MSAGEGERGGRIRWGTSSWSEKSWVGSFYPAGTRPADFLPYYATRFDTVEADNTYYAVPDRRLVEGWERKLPEGVAHRAGGPPSPIGWLAPPRCWQP